MDFESLLLGNFDHYVWLYGGLLSFLGFFLFKLITFERRSRKSTKFNFVFWVHDNIKEMMIGFIVFYVAMRFHTDVNKFFTTYAGIPLIENKYFFVFVIGLGFQILLKKLRSTFRIRKKTYPDGTKRQEHEN